MKKHLIISLVALSFVATILPSCSDEPFDLFFNKKLWSERVAPIVEGCETDYEKAKAICRKIRPRRGFVYLLLSEQMTNEIVGS